VRIRQLFRQQREKRREGRMEDLIEKINVRKTLTQNLLLILPFHIIRVLELARPSRVAVAEIYRQR
jgi:hypothetical protein